MQAASEPARLRRPEIKKNSLRTAATEAIMHLIVVSVYSYRFRRNGLYLKMLEVMIWDADNRNATVTGIPVHLEFHGRILSGQTTIRNPPACRLLTGCLLAGQAITKYTDPTSYDKQKQKE